MVVMVGSPVWGQGVEMIDFEEHPANPPGTPGESIDPDFYRDRGVRFESGTVLRYEEGFASSGRNGLEMCYSREFCAAPFQIGFDVPQQGVAVRVGYSGTLDEPARVLMVAFDNNGARVAVAELMLEPGSPVPVGPELAVEDLAGRITAVEVRWSDASRIMNFLVIDDLVFEPFVPVVDFAADPIPLFFESIESVAGEIVVTNIGNVAVSFFVTLNDPAGAFELLGTTCNEGLAPGDSCVLQVRFGPRDAGEYTTEAVLRGQDGGPIFAIPISGRKPLPEVTPTTVAPPATAPPLTVAPTPVAPTAAPVGPSSSDGDGDSNTTLILVLLVAIGAIGGSVLLIRRWWAKRPNEAQPSDGTPPPTPTVTVTPDEGSYEITTDDRRPVTAIRVAVDPGRTTTTLTEENPS
jgi:hypothetical protein